MSDAFGEWWPDDFIDQLYAVMALTPLHTYVNLSKRPERRRRYLDDYKWYARAFYLLADLAPTGEDGHRAAALLSKLQFENSALPNVIEGTSVSCQPEADDFIPILLRTRAALRVVSCEPLLGPINLLGVGPEKWDALRGNRPPFTDGKFDAKFFAPAKLDWVIAGGESGSRARPMHPNWARALRDQCKAAEVAFFFKQWGEWVPLHALKGKGPEIVIDARGRDVTGSPGKQDQSCARMFRVGKKAAGRLLDGHEHSAFPRPRAAAAA